MTATPLRLRPGEVAGWATYGLHVIAFVLLPVIAIVGVAPDLEAAVYFTYVVRILVGAAWTLLALVLFWVLTEMLERVFPVRMAMRAAWPMRARWRLELGTLALLLPMHLALVVILLGVAPGAEEALYFGALVLLLLVDVCMLLFVVVSGGRPQVA